MNRLVLILAPLILGGCASLFGPAQPCQEPVYRAFDFWLGEWTVHRSQASQAPASNRISLIMQGCALKEQYSTQAGYSGESLSWYDPEQGQWRQSWVDNSGTVLQLAGGRNEQGAMVLQGRSRRDERGDLILDRITWTPQPDGTVLQVWDSFNPAVQAWQRVFEGLYVRQPEAAAKPQTAP